MSDTSRKRSDEFLAISDQFKLGALTTETSHPVTANLSDTAKNDISAALKQLFDVDKDVLKTFEDLVNSGRAREIQQTVNDLLNRAIDDGRHLASGTYINELVAG